MKALHLLAKTYGQKPSSWILADRSNLSTADAAWALDFDLAVLHVGSEYEEERMREARARTGL
jgi:hypothetical protein